MGLPIIRQPFSVIWFFANIALWVALLRNVHYSAGINCTEIARLRYGNVHKDVIYYRRHKTGKDMMFPLTPANLPILHRYWVDGKGMDDYIFPILDKTRYQTDTHVMGKNLYHQPYKTIRFHKGFRVGHNNGIDHPSIYRLLIPSRE